MGGLAVVLTALVTGVGAVALNPWLRSVARTESRWLVWWLPALLAGLGGAGAAAIAASWPELAGFALLALGCALLVVIDLAAYRLPDIIVGPLYPILLVALALAAALTADWARLGRAGIVAGSLLVVYFLLAFRAPSQLGLGDVKLSGLLGGFLGWLGWPEALLGTLAAFACSAVVAIVLLITTRANRRTEFPFGPWMVVGAALGAAWGPTVFPAVG